jgi:hypothetical protein
MLLNALSTVTSDSISMRALKDLHPELAKQDAYALSRVSKTVSPEKHGWNKRGQMFIRANP